MWSVFRLAVCSWHIWAVTYCDLWFCYWCKKCCLVVSGRSNQEQSQVSNETTTFKWTIDGFSSLLDKGNGWTYSSVFQIRGLNWYNYSYCFILATPTFEHVYSTNSILTSFLSLPFCELVSQVLKTEPKGYKEWRQRRICFPQAWARPTTCQIWHGRGDIFHVLDIWPVIWKAPWRRSRYGTKSFLKKNLVIWPS
jgi:hypothetical protein